MITDADWVQIAITSTQALFFLVLVGVTIYYARQTKLIAHETSKQAISSLKLAEIAEKDFAERMRPWIGLELIKPAADAPKNWTVAVKNYGSGVATHMHSWIHTNIPSDSGLGSAIREFPSPMTLFPGHTRTFGLHFDEIETHALESRGDELITMEFYLTYKFGDSSGSFISTRTFEGGLWLVNPDKGEDIDVSQPAWLSL